MKPTWLYHKTEPAMIFDADTDDMAALHEAGWLESPAYLVVAESESEMEPKTTKTVTHKTTKKA